MEWKFIPHTNELYSCSEEGVIRNNKTEKLLGGTLTLDGYRAVTLKMSTGKPKSHLYHRIVAMTWHENPEGLPQVDHIDKNRLNNHPSNLRWILSRDNVDKAKHITYRDTVVLISPEGIEVEVDCAYTLAKQENLHQDDVRYLMDGRRMKHKGWTKKGS